MNTGIQFRFSCISLALLVALAGSLSAQQGVGALYGSAADTDGNALAGVALSLTGYGELKVQTTDSLGQFRFLGLDPGIWSLEAKLDGFSTLDCSLVLPESKRGCRRDQRLCCFLAWDQRPRRLAH